MPPHAPSPGQLATLRRSQFVARNVQASVLPRDPAPAPLPQVRRCSIGEDSIGEERKVRIANKTDDGLRDISASLRLHSNFSGDGAKANCTVRAPMRHDTLDRLLGQSHQTHSAAATTTASKLRGGPNQRTTF
jgi:hypothetical protein